MKKSSTVQNKSSRISTNQTKHEEDLIDFLNDNTNSSFSEVTIVGNNPGYLMCHQITLNIND